MIELMNKIRASGIVQIHSLSGELLAESHNLEVDSGLALIASLLKPDNVIYTGNITYCAIGTSATAPAASDIKLGAETKRNMITLSDLVGTNLVMQSYFLAADCGVNIREVGVFAHNATAAPDSGIMINRALISYDNSGSPKDIIITVSLSFSAASSADTLPNLLINGSFEIGDPPTNWTLVGTGATVSRSKTQVKKGAYSGLLTRVGTDCEIRQLVSDFAPYKGKTLTIGCWVYATVASRARIIIDDGVSSGTSGFHSGTPGWEWLTVTYTVNSGATYIRARLLVVTGNTSAYFDNVILVRVD